MKIGENTSVSSVIVIAPRLGISDTAPIVTGRLWRGEARLRAAIGGRQIGFDMSSGPLVGCVSYGVRRETRNRPTIGQSSPGFHMWVKPGLFSLKLRIDNPLRLSPHG